ncbi:FAD-binding oxidoreductase, partial [Xanthomonas sp. Kuri4-2]
VRLHEHSPVLRLERGPRVAMHTARGHVAADFAVLAGNAWLQGIAPELESRIMPVGTYIGASAVLGAARARALIRNDMAVADSNWALDYYRLSRDHRLLFGGRASYSSRPPPGLARLMTRRMHTVFPQLRDVALEQVWGGYVDISRNRAPHWGRLTPNVYFAQGFSGHGVAATGLAGSVIAEAIAGQSRRLDLFARIPHRPFPGGRRLRTPLLVAAMSWYRLRDALW